MRERILAFMVEHLGLPDVDKAQEIWSHWYSITNQTLKALRMVRALDSLDVLLVYALARYPSRVM